MVRKLLILIFLIVLPVVAGAQTIEQLREQIRRAEQEIRASTELLNKTRNQQQVSQTQLKVIQTQIQNRRQMINSLEEQITLLNESIIEKNGSISTLEDQLEQLKKDYARMVVASYKSYKVNNFLVFLFASSDFNDATRRIDFIRRYNRQRQLQAEQIASLTDSIQLEVVRLDSALLELDESRNQRQEEISSLGKDENQYRTTVANLRQQETRLNQEVQAKRAQIEQANRRIAELIAEESRRNESRDRTTAEREYDMTLSGKFDQNMGKLPYPVRGGVIVDKHGKHSVQPGVVVNNVGVTIAAEKGADVTCVFEGEVSRVFAISGMHGVMVRHGSYLSVYLNLATVSVKMGDKVAINQRIGKLPATANDDDNVLHFGIWKETTSLDPQKWLRR